MINLDDFDVAEPQAKSVSTGTHDGGLTIVFHINGKRLMFSKRVLEMLGNPEKVNFAFAGEYLVITAEENGKFALRNMSGSQVIYNAPLIREILHHFKIDHGDRFCRTFSEIEEIEGQSNAIAIKMSIRSGEQ